MPRLIAKVNPEDRDVEILNEQGEKIAVFTMRRVPAGQAWVYDEAGRWIKTIFLQGQDDLNKGKGGRCASQ